MAALLVQLAQLRGTAPEVHGGKQHPDYEKLQMTCQPAYYGGQLF